MIKLKRLILEDKHWVMVDWPLRLFDCSTICDGAYCVLLAAAEIAKNFTDVALYVIGTEQVRGKIRYNLHLLNLR